ncbi:hypothetical protein CL631_01060 [bacterium]|jgi:hypothetical protein|nr:hypothetical protein [bacterium]MDP6659818.1 hypothetical protein [Candidatus Paceibacterota bacterium]|tara:strand:- start:52250 stop:53248 length:999 start_codon:yes stop_codon:yes gene_type:complete
MKTEFTILLIVVSAVLAVFIFSNIDMAPEDKFRGLAVRDFEKEQEFWDKRIDKVGVDVAYVEFKEEYKDYPYGPQHTLAHIFGILLYDKKGIEGVAICDGAFAFGCYHSFFGLAITEGGLAMIHDLDKACIAAHGVKGLGCPHGIGHGILSFVGYDNLDEALDECRTLTWKEPIGGCTSGVFMEYNFLTMEDPLGLSHREEVEDKHFPCSSIEDRFKQACYFEQPTWWKVVYAPDEGYRKVGELCEEVEDTLNREACFRGIGNTISGISGFDIESTKSECESMPEREGKTLCLQGAAWLFSAEPGFDSVWKSLCRGLNKDEESVCLSGENFI